MILLIWDNPFSEKSPHLTINLLNNLINIGALDKKNKTPIFYIVKYCDPKVTIQFFNKYPDVNYNQTDIKGRTLLHHICRYSKASLFQFIITNTEDNFGYKTIHLCIIYNQNEFKYMMEYVGKNGLCTNNHNIIYKITNNIYSHPKLIKNILPILISDSYYIRLI